MLTMQCCVYIYEDTAPALACRLCILLGGRLLVLVTSIYS